MTVLVPGALRVDSDGAARLDLPVRATLAELLDEVRARWPRLERRLRDERGQLRRYVNIYVDGEDCRPGGRRGHAATRGRGDPGHPLGGRRLATPTRVPCRWTSGT